MRLEYIDLKDQLRELLAANDGNCEKVARELNLGSTTVRKYRTRLNAEDAAASIAPAKPANAKQSIQIPPKEQPRTAAPKKVAVPAKKKHDNSRILFISDMHIPYHHPNVIPFLAALKKKYNPTRIICLGDEVDKHAMSFHSHDPDLMSAGDELRAARLVIAQIELMFPEMDLVSSNHGSLAYRKAKEHGIPKDYMRTYNDVLGVGPGWVWHDSLIIDLPDGQQVFISHGQSADASKTGQAMSMSHVCGHYHNSFGIKFWTTPNGRFFAINGGCLINNASLAFAYNKTNVLSPSIGTPLIIDGMPILETMPL
jgi:hypothetical protein